jgi:hypothetical protein
MWQSYQTHFCSFSTNKQNSKLSALRTALRGKGWKKSKPYTIHKHLSMHRKDQLTKIQEINNIRNKIKEIR